MIEFKFTAEKLNGQLISGTLSAKSVTEGKNRIYRLAEKNQLKVKSIEKSLRIIIESDGDEKDRLAVNKKLFQKRK